MTAILRMIRALVKALFASRAALAAENLALADSIELTRRVKGCEESVPLNHRQSVAALLAPVFVA